MKKEDLKKLKGLLYGLSLGVIPITLSGCNRGEGNVKSTISSSNYYLDDVGFFKNGEEYILYWHDTKLFSFNQWAYYVYTNGQYLGDEKKSNQKLNHCDILKKDGNILYDKYFQMFPFIECNPDVYYNYETVSAFTEETLKNLEESYFANHTFSAANFRIYEILNLTTNEVNYIIGRKVSGTQVFNFETYTLEDYTGYAIKDMEFTFDKGEYYYSEILELIKNYREENKGMLLERK